MDLIQSSIDRVPRDELAGRLTRFQARLREHRVDIAIISQGVDLVYLAGTRQQAHLLIPRYGEPLLLTRKSARRAAWESPWPSRPMRSLRDLPSALAEVVARPARIGLELDVLPVLAYRQYESLWPDTEIVDIGGLLREQRAVKTPWELDRIRDAAVISDAICRAVPDILREGMTELELSARLEAVGRSLGHQGLTPMRAWNMDLYYGVAGAGPSVVAPGHFDGPIAGLGVSVAGPTGASHRPIGRGEPVIVDFVSVSGGYMCDQTRTFSIGPLPGELRDAYAAMREVYATITRSARPGAVGGDVYDQAVARAAALGMADVFMGTPEERVSFVAHGVGLEVDELPLLARGYKGALEEGMVLAVEPKAVFPALGCVGLENTTVVTRDGLASLSLSSEEIVVV